MLADLPAPLPLPGPTPQARLSPALAPPPQVTTSLPWVDACAACGRQVSWFRLMPGSSPPRSQRPWGPAWFTATGSTTTDCSRRLLRLTDEHRNLCRSLDRGLRLCTGRSGSAPPAALWVARQAPLQARPPHGPPSVGLPPSVKSPRLAQVPVLVRPARASLRLHLQAQEQAWPTASVIHAADDDAAILLRWPAQQRCRVSSLSEATRPQPLLPALDTRSLAAGAAMAMAPGSLMG